MCGPPRWMDLVHDSLGRPASRAARSTTSGSSGEAGQRARPRARQRCRAGRRLAAGPEGRVRRQRQALAPPAGPVSTATSSAAPSTSTAAPRPPPRSRRRDSRPGVRLLHRCRGADAVRHGAGQAVIKAGKLVDVVALHLTDQGGRSVSISASAAPTLRSEALAAGSAHINAVSGASYTSAGYIQSLQSALDAARAAGA